ncbi:MAG: hypothetical protein INQ03_21565 [Candidatus Heimdallarchaeota archaeon]|nr:hypothetical protein [Candidatus Heimdallarchaeota archaeon]
MDVIGQFLVAVMIIIVVYLFIVTLGYKALDVFSQRVHREPDSKKFLREYQDKSLSELLFDRNQLVMILLQMQMDQPTITSAHNVDSKIDLNRLSKENRLNTQLRNNQEVFERRSSLDVLIKQKISKKMQLIEQSQDLIEFLESLSVKSQINIESLSKITKFSKDDLMIIMEYITTDLEISLGDFDKEQGIFTRTQDFTEYIRQGKELLSKMETEYRDIFNEVDKGNLKTLKVSKSSK